MVASLSEQIFASAFTFFIFVVATRMLAQDDLSMYSAYFSLSQSFSFFLMGLVLFPVASSSGEETSKQLGISVVLLGALLGAFALVSPLAMSIFHSFDGRVDLVTWGVAVAFFTSQCLYETARWLTIRMRGARSALPITVARFILFFGTLAWLGSERLNGTGFALAQVASNVAAMLAYGVGLGGLLHAMKPKLPDRSALLHLAMFGNSIASFATNFTAVTLVDRAWSGAGLAAFQAMRSATNPIGLISQLIDNHFSAYLARSGQRISFGSRRIAAALAVTAALVAVAVPVAPHATGLILPEGFGDWWLLFPAMLFASLAHAITRPIFVNWRLAADRRSLNIYSALLVTVVMPSMVLLWWVGATFAMVVLFAAQPIVSFLPLAYRRRALSSRAPQQ